jgi:uncharacterized alkaline shock family protein YloU
MASEPIEATPRRKLKRREEEVVALEAEMRETEMVEPKKEEKPMLQEKIKEQEMTARLEELEKGEEFLITGETSINDDVIASIVGVAAKEVEGIASLGTPSVRRSLAERIGGAQTRARGVGVEAGKREAILDISVSVVYGFNIPRVVIELRKTVATRLLELAAIVAKEINVKVTAIEFPERMPGRLT